MTAIQLRLAGFASAIVLLGLMIAWAAHASLLRVKQLSDKLTSAQISSFQTADYFQARLKELDYALLRYLTRRDHPDREQFVEGWDALNKWIDSQKPTLITPKELAILNQIDNAYDDYHAAATNLLSTIDHETTTAQTTSAEFKHVEGQSRRLLDFAYQLLAATLTGVSQPVHCRFSKIPGFPACARL